MSRDAKVRLVSSSVCRTCNDKTKMPCKWAIYVHQYVYMQMAHCQVYGVDIWGWVKTLVPSEPQNSW